MYLPPAPNTGRCSRCYYVQLRAGWKYCKLKGQFCKYCGSSCDAPKDGYKEEIRNLFL